MSEVQSQLPEPSSGSIQPSAGETQPSAPQSSAPQPTNPAHKSGFSGRQVAVIVLGYVLSTNIAHPILRLRALSQAVAAGDLNQKTQLNRPDEIGELAEAFDTMTQHLRERTDEAARLYAETAVTPARKKSVPRLSAHPA